MSYAGGGTDIDKVSRTLAAVKAIKDVVAQTEARAKAELLDAVARATLYPAVDGVELATVTVVKGSAGKPYVRDPAAFLAWVKANRPGAIVETVRSSDQEAILKACVTTGELPDGVDVSEPGVPYVSVKQTPEQRDATVQAWQAGTLTIPTLLAVEAS